VLLAGSQLKLFGLSYLRKYIITFIKFNYKFKQHHTVVPVDKERVKSKKKRNNRAMDVHLFTFLQLISFVLFDDQQVQKHKYINRKCVMEEFSLLLSSWVLLPADGRMEIPQ
jgi:hypothetical protein